jgi:hypothetical protein
LYGSQAWISYHWGFCGFPGLSETLREFLATKLRPDLGSPRSRFNPVIREGDIRYRDFLEEFRQRAAKRGVENFLNELRNHYLSQHTGVGGRREIDDTERLVRMAHHLVEDADLRESRLNRQSDDGVLTEAARRAIRDLPGPGDIIKGDILPKASRRLLAKFKKLPPFYAWDDTAEHGWDHGHNLT